MMTYPSCWPVPPLVALAVFWLSCADVSAQSLRSLFLEDIHPTLAVQNNGYLKQTAAHSHRVRVDSAVLAQVSGGNDKEVSFRIKFDGEAEHVATVIKLETSDDRYRVYAGTLEDEANSQIIIVTDGKCLAWSVHTVGRGS